MIDNHIGGPIRGIVLIGRLCSLTIGAEGACAGIGEVRIGGRERSHTFHPGSRGPNTVEPGSNPGRNREELAGE